MERASDGCHKYGWAINLIVMVVMFAYFVGGLNTTVTDLRAQVASLTLTIVNMDERLTRVEGQVDLLKLEVQMNGSSRAKSK